MNALELLLFFIAKPVTSAGIKSNLSTYLFSLQLFFLLFLS